MHRSVRLLHLQTLLYQNPRGYRSSELARMCRVNQRTINRDLLDLQDEPFGLPLVQPDRYRWCLMEGHRFCLPPVRLSLQEAAALYLAARLLDNSSDEPNPFVGRALAALGAALPGEVGVHVQALAGARLRDSSGAYARVFEVVTLGWAMRRKVRMLYRSAGREDARETVLSPYWIEPSAVGFAAYVNGYSSAHGEPRTFKLERIAEANLLDETFEEPADLDLSRQLANAWGVMYGDETVEVALRFSPAVARRVKETRWHASQAIEDCAGGGCILRVRIAHTVEMKPWIRQWGPECEVLAPPELRSEVGEEMRRAGEVYQLQNRGGGTP